MCMAPSEAPLVPSPLEKTRPLALLNGAGLWVLIVSWPLVLYRVYDRLWPEAWYISTTKERPRPLGLILGMAAVAWGHVFVLGYQFVRHHLRRTWFGPLVKIQPNEERTYDFSEGVATHLRQPEGFVLLGLYLSLTWMFQKMPATYYAFEGGITWHKVFLCLCFQDFYQFVAHKLEHVAHKAIYRASHKPHHRFTNPRLFDAFNGSVADTVCMILVPLYLTALTVPCNVWDYMTFGTLYANWLVLIHSEYHHAWDPLFAFIGFGTAADHHVHHKLFVKNFGHLFMFWDKLAGSYKDPSTVRVFQNKQQRPLHTQHTNLHNMVVQQGEKTTTRIPTTTTTTTTTTTSEKLKKDNNHLE